ncbi:putative pre-16S rRNA nuclease [Desulfovibrionales bacterium]
MKVLGIDFGTRRVGLAMTGPENVALPLRTIKRTTRKALFVALDRVIIDHDIERIVLGLPGREPDPDEFDLPKIEALIRRQVHNFAASLGRRTGLPIEFTDENLSSFEAEERLRAAGWYATHIVADLDAQAAAVILESWLTGRRSLDRRRLGSEFLLPAPMSTPDYSS